MTVAFDTMTALARRAGRPKRLARTARISACCLLLALPLQVPISAAQEAEQQAPAVDISKWKCKFCEFEEGWYSELSLGLGYVDEDSYRFGGYNGLHEEGAYLIGDGNLRYRSEDASYLDISFWDIGLDSRSLAIAGGRQGSFDLYLRYDELPHFVSDSARTPYLGNGSDTLTLPAGWVSAGSTAGMSALEQSLRAVELETERKRLGTGIAITTASPWSYRLDLRRDDKDGNKRTGGAFLFNSAQLIEPVDYVTDEIDASISYTEKDWSATVGYYISTFSNKNEALTWDNAYSPVGTQPDEGQLALPPDNEFQQLTLVAAYRINERNHLSGSIAIGRMEQDERLLQATVNPNLTPVLPALPTDSANAEVETTNVELKFASMMTDRLRLSASYDYDDRDNKTPQLMYDWVVTDIVPATQRGNLPYGYTRNLLEFKADYDYAKGTRLGVGYNIEERERTFREVDETSENTLWGTMRVRNVDNLFLEFKVATSSREASTSRAVAAITPPQNALMSKYDVADRERDSVSIFTGFSPGPDYTVGLDFEIARDDYDNSELGLTRSDETGVNVDISAMLSETIGLSAFLGRQDIDSSQSGSQAFAGADWVADTDDRFEHFGIAMTYVVTEDTLDVGVEYSSARSTSEIQVNHGAPEPGFPKLRSDLETIKLYLNYRLNENMRLRAAYWYESYDSSDWALDDVAADTMGNLLSFGELSPDYDNHVVKLALDFQF